MSSAAAASIGGGRRGCPACARQASRRHADSYWEDVDAAWERAVAAGAEVVYPLADEFYGERGGRLRDPFGQQWMLSQRIERLSRQEIGRRAAGFFAAS